MHLEGEVVSRDGILVRLVAVLTSIAISIVHYLLLASWARQVEHEAIRVPRCEDESNVADEVGVKDLTILHFRILRAKLH